MLILSKTMSDLSETLAGDLTWDERLQQHKQTQVLDQLIGKVAEYESLVKHEGKESEEFVDNAKHIVASALKTFLGENLLPSKEEIQKKKELETRRKLEEEALRPKFKFPDTFVDVKDMYSRFLRWKVCAPRDIVEAWNSLNNDDKERTEMDMRSLLPYVESLTFADVVQEDQNYHYLWENFEQIHDIARTNFQLEIIDPSNPRNIYHKMGSLKEQKAFPSRAVYVQRDLSSDEAKEEIANGTIVLPKIRTVAKKPHMEWHRKMDEWTTVQLIDHKTQLIDWSGTLQKVVQFVNQHQYTRDEAKGIL